MKNQPIVTDEEGTYRWQKNNIVAFLMSTSQYDLNWLAINSRNLNFTDEDWAQFSQLHGYSVYGWMDLSYVSDEMIESAEADVKEYRK